MSFLNSIRFSSKRLSILFSLFMLLVLGASSSLYGQNIGSQSQQFRQADGIFRVAEPGQLADSVNVWGDIPITGRFIIPIGTSLPELMSYAGGPRNLNTDLFNISKVKIVVNISRYKGGSGQTEISNFEFKYKDPIPSELYNYNIQNNDIVSIEVRRRPNFLDYFRVIGPVITTITSILVLSRRL